MRKKPIGFTARLEHSVQLLQKAEKLALQYSPEGFYLAFSGGKDSQAVFHLCKLAGVRFQPYFNQTTLEPPELIHFVKRQYPSTIFLRPRITFAKLCIRKKMLPTRKMRFCCKEFREICGAGYVVLTGVRKKESVRRRSREEIEVISRNENRNFRGTKKEFYRHQRLAEMQAVDCVFGKDRIVMNPIVYWSEADVWYFLNEIVRVEHCSLYDAGWKRIGCLFCPMSSKAEIAREIVEFPRYHALILRTIKRLREVGFLSRYPELTSEQIFDWWQSKQNFASWLMENSSEDVDLPL